MQISIEKQIIKELKGVPVNVQKKILDFIKKQKETKNTKKNSIELLEFCGVISENEAEDVQKIIENECEKIDEIM